MLDKAKLPTHFTPHGLRHTYASLLLAEGVDVHYVSDQLGHGSIEPTVSTYGAWLKPKRRAGLHTLVGFSQHVLSFWSAVLLLIWLFAAAYVLWHEGG